ncbi:hypothetical protein DPMN_066961 [Dreissena polymorpha]|uniref:Uncharacterized protein n=1 Tax=Dreissena polymorpha TaxID=45954 RepID=A0A9D4BKZ5_DREPO|nr:hypothetical protein DPMN_066961 [Dreissena polymorpha]
MAEWSKQETFYSWTPGERSLRRRGQGWHSKLAVKKASREEERARSLSLSQKQKKARENCLPKKESVEPDIVLPPLFYYIKLQNYSDPCNTIKHLTISNSTTERAHGNRNQGRLWNRGALCIPLEPPLTPLGAESTKTTHKL